jgi:flavin reductase (DIM6/NTAB) family NADH-FMN oxidoreductase RutF
VTDTGVIRGIDNPTELRQAFTLYPRGVMAVSAYIDCVPVGFAVSAFVSVSLDPPLILICVDAASTTWPTLSTSPGIGVSVIAEDQAWLGRQLASRTRDRFSGASFERRDSGALLLDGAATKLECTIKSVMDGGDHLMVLLNVVDMWADPAVEPLVWHDSHFAGVRPLTES